MYRVKLGAPDVTPHWRRAATLLATVVVAYLHNRGQIGLEMTWRQGKLFVCL